jgi:hypothetical protein
MALAAHTAPARAQSPDSTTRDSAVVDTMRKRTIIAEELRRLPRRPLFPVTRTVPLERALADEGFANITVWSDSAIAYENRRWRHSAEARGRARDVGFGPTRVIVYERRLGMTAAAITDTGGGVPAAVRYPSDADFVVPPAGARVAPTSRTLDLEVRPRFSYELGRIFDPVLIRFEVEPALLYNPWPGARATASFVVPMRNDFSIDDLHPDINRVRAGVVSLDQFGWWPHVALLSASAGLFGENRYGVSFGAARPLASGAFLLDAQADFTGFIAATDSGTVYSAPEHWTGFAGVTWRPAALDLAVRLRAERFLYGDHGAELEVRRTMGDVDIGLFYQRTSGFGVQGVRIAVPIPPMIRPQWPVRVLPVARLPLDYRDEAAPVGRALHGVADREDYLRQLSLPELTASAHRYRPGPAAPGPNLPPQWVSLTGMTGFVNTPWAGVMADRSIELGYNRIPKAAAYDHRGLNRNDVYYASIGFLPHAEVGLRWTVIPGLLAFGDIVPDSKLTDSDRMLSGRLELLPATPRRPGLAVGIEDAMGTRRFHSTYVVTGIPVENNGLRARVSLGYAPRVFTASRYTLDGGFAAVEVSPWRPFAATLEYDTEKWNTSLGIDLGLGFRARAALLSGRDVSIGAGWFVAL